MKIKKSIKMLVFLTILLVIYSSMALAAGERIITGLEVQGNSRIPAGDILAAAKSKVAAPLDQVQLEKDIKSIYNLGYFQDIKVSFQDYRGGVKVIFQMKENPVIQKISIKGSCVFSEKEMLGWFKSAPGGILNKNELDSDLKGLLKKYQDQGYILAEIKNASVSPEGIITITVNEGYLNNIVIKGNEKTKDFVILREFDLTQGDVLNINQVRSGLTKLAGLNYFQDIKTDFKRVDKDSNRADLILNVTEKKTGNLSLGATYSTKDGLLGTVKINEDNLLGRGQSLGFDWEFGGASSYSLHFLEPWLLGTPTSFGVNIYDISQSGSDSYKGDYREHRQGGAVSLGHPLTEEWNGKLSFKMESSTINWKDDSYNNKGQDIPLLDENNNLHSLTLTASRDTTDKSFNPVEGSIDTLGVEYAGQMLGGDTDFTKFNLDLRKYLPGFKNNQAWALRLKAGIGDRALPELEKYRLGGANTLRGYDTGAFSGNDMLLMNLEYRFPVADNFTGVLFTDGGNTWDSSDQISLGDLHYSLGAGLRMNTPMGMIRLDYGFNEKGDGIPHFSIGQTF